MEGLLVVLLVIVIILFIFKISIGTRQPRYVPPSPYPIPVYPHHRPHHRPNRRPLVPPYHFPHHQVPGRLY
jgi:hypothetical protein